MMRQAPQSIEAEQAVLGGMMLAPDAYDRVADRLNEDDFYRRDHQLIFRAIREMAEARPPRPYDAVTLGEWFEARGLGEQVYGVAYLIELASTTPSAANIEAYAHIVRDKAMARRAIEVGTKLVNDAFQPEGRDALDVIGAAQIGLAAVASAVPEDMIDSWDAVDSTWQALEKRRESRIHSGSAIAGISTGIHDLDIEINGLEGGCVYIIAGRPAMGKSTLAQNIAEHIAIEQKKAVDIFTFEMPVKQYTERMLISASRIPGSRVRGADLDDHEWGALGRARTKVKVAPWRISMPKTRSVRYVTAQSRRAHAKKKRGAIVVDYLQLLEDEKASRRSDSKNAEVGMISGQLKQLAVELDVPVIVLSQLSRDVENRPDKRPRMADLRDSGAIEQDADVILFIYRDEYYYPNSPDAGTAEIIIGKQRSGRGGHSVRVKCDLGVYRFENLPFGWEPKPKDPGEGKSRSGGGYGRSRKSARDAAAGES